MRALTARAALRAWERGQSLDPQARALALLSAALPKVDRSRLRQLPIGQRDALLLRLRQRTFGHQVLGFARCDRCQARLEFNLDLRTFAAATHLQRRVPPERLLADGFEVLFRLPDSTDLDFVAENCIEVGPARRILLERCVLKASRDGREVTPAELPEALVERIGERMQELDPLAEMPLEIICDRCEHCWLTIFDIGRFLWQDVSQAARQLLDEVHALATLYGWTEPQILALSAARRKYYLEKAPEPR